MILIKPTKIYSNKYHYCARNNQAEKTFLYDFSHQVYWLDDMLEIHHAGILNEHATLQYGTISFHPAKNQAAVILADKSLAVSDFTGKLLWQKQGNFVSLIFSRDGKWIWGVERLDMENIRLWIFNSQEGSEQYFYEMEDDMCDSWLVMDDIPNSDNITLGLLAGQDGVSVYECSFMNKEFNLREMFPHKSYIPPAWNLDSSSIFSLENDDSTFAHFSYPDFKLLSEQTDVDFDNEDLCPGYGMIYLKNGLVITQNANYRFFLMNPMTMQRIDEIVFEGYEPLPTNIVFPSLKDDDSLYSILNEPVRIGNIIAVSTARKSEKQDILLINEKNCLDIEYAGNGDAIL